MAVVTLKKKSKADCIEKSDRHRRGKVDLRTFLVTTIVFCMINCDTIN